MVCLAFLPILSSVILVPPQPQVCPPAWFAANVVHHPVRLQQLAAAFSEALAFDASIAGMLLYAGVPPAGAATSYGTAPAARQAAAAAAGPAGSAGATGGEAEQQAQTRLQQLAAQGGSGGSVVLLPRMPLGLVLVTTAAAYEAVASALRAAAALAAAADAVPNSSGTALRRLVDAFVTRLQQLLEVYAASSRDSDGSGRLQRRRRQKPEAQQGAADGSTLSELEAGGQQPWQLQAATVAVVLAELLLGASPAWQPSWEPHGRAAGSDGCPGPVASSCSRELEAVAAVVVQELVQEAVWALPTSAPQAALPGGAADGTAPPLQATVGPQEQRLTAQQLGCNALLLRAAIECCGAAARALGSRFAQNGRLLRAALLPLLDKLGEIKQVMTSPFIRDGCLAGSFITPPELQSLPTLCPSLSSPSLLSPLQPTAPS